MNQRKCSFLLVLAALFVLLPLQAQTARINSSLQNVTLKQFIAEIEKQSDFTFMLDNTVDQTQRVSVTAKQQTIQTVLSQALSPTGLSYEIVGKQIILKVKTTPTSQTTKKISGVVVDDRSEPIIGANVSVKGTTNGTITDMDGNFTLDVVEGSTLLVSYIGYTTNETPIGRSSSYTIVIAEDMQKLDEVVVMGYGTARKATVTGSVASVKGAEIMKTPVMNVSNALVGLLPGVSATQRGGEPGNDGSSIRIRGVNTLGDNSALVVIDGVPGRSLDRIEPTSIESITVLKDASAAIYGSQAANGVILVTTKRGAEGKAELTVNFNQGFNQPTRTPKMANAFEYASMLNEIDSYGGRQARYDADQLQKFADGSDPWRYPDTDWFAATTKNWSAQNYLNATLTGGSEKWKYFLSLGTKYQDGYYKNSASNYKQYDFRSNIDGIISKNVKLNFDIAGRLEDANYPTRGFSSIYRMILRGKPIYPAFWPDGTPGPDLEYGDNPAVVSTDATGYDNQQRYVLNSNLKLDIDIPWVKGLTFTGTASLDKEFHFNKKFETPWYLYSWDGKTLDDSGTPVLIKGKKGLEDPRLTQQVRDLTVIQLNGVLNYQTTIGSHGLKAMAGIETRSGTGSFFEAYRRYFISTTIDELFAGGDKDKNNTGSSYQNAWLNLFGRINYSFKEKYLVEFVWRYDGSYRFPDTKRFGFFPGVSLGWRASEETFWKENISFIENFKLRASWGQTGNDRIEDWQYLSTYGFNSNNYTYIFGSTIENKLLSEQRIPNPNVTWEVANQSNIGFDASFLESKLSLETDFYLNKRSQILWQRNASVPSSTGLVLPRENIGTVENKGFEYNLIYRDKIKEMKYSVSFNGGYSKSKITFWDESPGRPVYQQSTGKPIPTNPKDPDQDLYYQAIGIFRDAAHVESYPSWANARPGDIIFEDVNLDGKIDANDRVRSDKTNIPTFSGGLNLSLWYKQFDFSVLFQGAAGAVQYVRTESGEIGNYLKNDAVGRWTEQNKDAKYPRATLPADYWWTGSTFYLFNTDYIRLKNIELGYTLPQSALKAMRIQSLRVYLSAYNLFTFCPGMPDFDPELVSNNGRAYPIQRVINGGISLTF